MDPDYFPLHKVVYRTTDSAIANVGNKSLEMAVYKWLDQNCKGRFYRSPPWTWEKYIQFEDKKDAVLFALTFSNSV